MTAARRDMKGDDEILEIDLDDLLRRLEFDGTVPTDREAAAVAAAIATHWTDRERAATEATAGESSPETISEWTLAGRFESSGVNPRRRPRNVERGREWQAAARSL